MWKLPKSQDGSNWGCNLILPSILNPFAAGNFLLKKIQPIKFFD
jgi:hypothetical protein